MMEIQSAVRSMESAHKSLLVLRCKVVVVGDAHVGKSALISMFHSGGSQFPKQYVMTSWVDFRVKQVTLGTTIVELYLFDCAGQSIFNQIEANNAHYDKANYVMLVYDVTNAASFESCGKWLQMVASGREEVPGVLVANKCDLTERRCVSTSQGQQFAQARGLTYLETSANDAYEAPFKEMAVDFARKYEGALAEAAHS